MQDQRLVNRLQNYWNQIRRGKKLPDIGQLNSAVIDDMWQQCMQISGHPAQGGTFHYVYQFMGKKLVQLYGRDITGQAMNPSATEYPMNIVAAKLDAIMRTGEFIIDESHFMNPHGRTIKYRACFMPFGNDTKGVTHIVIGFSGREF